MRKKFLQSTILCLLFSQFAVTAHAYEHDASHDDVQECEQCMQFLSGQDGIENSIEITHVTQYNGEAVNFPVSHYSSNPTRELRNKSPPLS